MPKKFSDQERAWINEKLLTEGRRSFEARGLKKTSVEDLTKAAGISQGSFYLFFGSKEELFFEILQEDEKRIRDTMLDSFKPGDSISKEGIKQFLLQAFQLMDDSPLLRQMTVRGEMEQLIRKLPQELQEKNFAEDKDSLMPVIETWQAQGILRGVASDLIVSLIRALVLLTLHKEEIGEKLFPATLELLVDLLAEGMVSR
ncbi:TetR/AcrR family transcriptional regulator [Paenibacillus wynnii]|uniref:TetR/AcrR family transcriptional regulator n=1 Tax=Paenibacillus wynnii TaxID=268407 RepID=UPI0027918E2C|nr:TetR/AcrR family transcriptional regulator [Paenibacillus wynnii]MDQ0196614.1 AcrR family transcriptional regulator [Paenibacillus wynnii]